MDADLSSFAVTGILAVVGASVAIMLLVRSDLGASGRVPRDGTRWFLAGALGMGVTSFAVKMAVAAAVVGFPDTLVLPLIADAGNPAPRSESGDGSGLAGFAVSASLASWRSLPDRPPDPPGNPTTPEKVALGKRLFHDTALSIDGTVSCATCHDTERLGGADGRPTAVGVTAVPGKRNTPTVWNAAYQTALFWDGRASSLEEQATGPLTNPDEMGNTSLEAVERRVSADPAYRAAFSSAFGDESPVTARRIVAAIAAYERTLVTPDAPYDRFVRGEPDALSQAQRRGMSLFRSVGCATCHSGPAFGGSGTFGAPSPFRLFPTASTPEARATVERYSLAGDRGRAASSEGRGLWRVPSLRNVAATGPWFHNGAVRNLEEAVRVMAVTQLGAVVGGDPRMAEDAILSADGQTLTTVRRRFLSDGDVADIAAFLHALTSNTLVAGGGER